MFSGMPVTADIFDATLYDVALLWTTLLMVVGDTPISSASWRGGCPALINAAIMSA